MENDPFNLIRFIEAQDKVLDTVISELKAAKKQSHWMWYIFPQLKALGRSSMSQYYGIAGMDEATAYLEEPLLRTRLEACLGVLMESPTSNPVRIFGETDSLKFHSSLTLFLAAEPINKLIQQVLNKFFQGITDYETEKLLQPVF